MTDHSILYYGLFLPLTNTSFAEYSLAVNYKKSNTCDLPESWNVLFEKYIVLPDESCKSFQVLRCINQTPALLYSLFQDGTHSRILHRKSPFQQQRNLLCLHREGVLCGQCSRDHAPPAYSFSLVSTEVQGHITVRDFGGPSEPGREHTQWKCVRSSTTS